MATWVIGDIHGCWETLQRLLATIEWDAGSDELWLVGDLVNRGPSSLEVLRWAVQHDDRITAVLGNHDIHLLGRACGVAERKKGDVLGPVLDAPDRDELLGWLGQRPLMHKFGRHLLVHAGLAPEWNVELAQGYAEAITADCGGGESGSMLAAIHTLRKEPWHVDLPREEALAAAAVVMTRIRTVGPGGRAVLDYTGPIGSAPEGCRPWFATAAVLRQGYTIIFGHWAMLGLYRARGVVCLDSGCVYGGRLSAMRLDDGLVVQEPVVDAIERSE
jgi:bis(5'-nucleosyl)-tetraphosphatase (symmetrical)